MGPKAPFLKSNFFLKIHKASKMKISPHLKIEPGLTLMSGRWAQAQKHKWYSTWRMKAIGSGVPSQKQGS
jgi:hypothetical protein